MKKKFSPLFLLLILISVNALLNAEVNVFSRYNYYTDETIAEIVVDATSMQDTLICNIFDRSEIIQPVKHNFISLDIQLLPVGTSNFYCTIDSINYDFEIVKLPYQKNCVKIDKITGGLLVNDLPFIPFGFYCYSPVQPTLPEEEVVKGFNMISPYQQILPETFEARKKYMDRCADLGMKVHYNLCSVAGGGGVNSNRQKLDAKELEEILRQDVLAFKDHPALLAWYISDEPVGQGVGVEIVEKAYNLVKMLDPYHPITMVFLSPKKAPAYINAMDIVMADPYPIPGGRIELVGEVADWLVNKFSEKPVWIVPQAFGGGEWWEREPTHQELRYMTWSAILYGATGIQYFIRHGLNSFPKSTTTWAECGAISLEVAELTPYILSYEKANSITSSNQNITIRTMKHENNIVVAVLNNQKTPDQFKLDVAELPKQAEVLFENRIISTETDSLFDYIEALGTRFYKFQINEPTSEKYKISAENIVLNPSYENNPSVGVPAGYYSKGRNEKGATYFIDSRTAIHGEHSLRFVNPKEFNGMKLKSYPIKLKKGKSYRFSIWAKADEPIFTNRNKPGFFKRLFKGWEKEKKLTFKIRIGNINEEFILTKEWQEYGFNLPITEKDRKESIHFELVGRGVAWFDLIQVVRNLEIFSSCENGIIMAEVISDQQSAEIRYTTDGTTPTKKSSFYSQPVQITNSGLFQAATVINGEITALAEMEFCMNLATGKKTHYNKLYRQYEAGGEYALVNGRTGSDDYHDGLWQGFISNNLDLVIDLEEPTVIQKIDINFLQVINGWVFLPEYVEIFTSDDGDNFYKVGTIDNDVSQREAGRIIKNFELLVKPRPTRYVKIVAKNPGTCPVWHKGAGGPSWIFADEIRVN